MATTSSEPNPSTQPSWNKARTLACLCNWDALSELNTHLSHAKAFRVADVCDDVTVPAPASLTVCLSEEPDVWVEGVDFFVTLPAAGACNDVAAAASTLFAKRLSVWLGVVAFVASFPAADACADATVAAPPFLTACSSDEPDVWLGKIAFLARQCDAM